MRHSSNRLTVFKLALALVGVVAAVAVTGASGADFDNDNGPCPGTSDNKSLSRCPTAFVGVKYEIQLLSEEDSGCVPHDWFEIVNSSLPPGLTMTRKGLISGVPTTAGLTLFWVWNHDLTAAQGGPTWCTFEDRSEREFSIYVDPGIAIVSQSVKPATTGQPYTDTLAAKQVVSLNPLTGEDVQATWFVESGALPPGISLSAAGVLSGTTTSEGNYGFVVRAHNGGALDTERYTLSVRQPLTVTSPIAPALRPSAEVGVRFAKTATAAGGTVPYTWSVGPGALPAGVTLNTATGAISGTPRSAGNFAFGLTATDADGRIATTNVALRVAPKLTITTSGLKTARLGTAYLAKIATAGGVRPLKWRSSGKLPPGVRFVKGVGTLVGTPRRTGTLRVAVETSDALGAKARSTLVLRVTS